MENSMEVPQKKKLKIELSYDPTTPLLGIYPKEMKSEPLWDVYTPIIIVTYTQKPRYRKKSTCPLTDKSDVNIVHLVNNNILYT